MGGGVATADRQLRPTAHDQHHAAIAITAVVVIGGGAVLAPRPTAPPPTPRSKPDIFEKLASGRRVMAKVIDSAGNKTYRPLI